MKRADPWIPLLLSLLLIPPGASSGEPESIELVSVEDGDTLVVMFDGQRERLQLAGIDAPEAHRNPKLTRDLQRTGLQAEALLTLGRSATTHLWGLVTDGPIEILGESGRRDRYGRLTVIIRGRDGRSVNEAMVADGYATVLEQGSLDPAFRQRLRELEQSARQNRLGIWGERQETALKWRGDS